MLRERSKDFNCREFPESLKKLGVSLGAKHCAPPDMEKNCSGGGSRSWESQNFS